MGGRARAYVAGLFLVREPKLPCPLPTSDSSCSDRRATSALAGAHLFASRAPNDDDSVSASAFSLFINLLSLPGVRMATDSGRARRQALPCARYAGKFRLNSTGGTCAGGVFCNEDCFCCSRRRRRGKESESRGLCSAKRVRDTAPAFRLFLNHCVPLSRVSRAVCVRANSVKRR